VRRDDTLRRMLTLRAAPAAGAGPQPEMPGTRAPSAGAVAVQSIDRARARPVDAAPAGVAAAAGDERRHAAE
jgi:hypothetical protein